MHMNTYIYACIHLIKNNIYTYVHILILYEYTNII